MAGYGSKPYLQLYRKVSSELRDLDDLEKLDPSDFDVPQWQWDSMMNALENEETAMVLYIVAYVVAFTVFFVLMFTSIHYLVKKKSDANSPAYVTESGRYVHESAQTNEQEYEYYSQSQDDRYN